MNYLFCNTVVNSIIKESNNDYSLLYYIGLKNLLTLNNKVIFSYKILIDSLNIDFGINIDIRKRNEFINYLHILEKFNLVSVKNNNNSNINTTIYLNFNLEKEKEYGYSSINEDEVKKIFLYNRKGKYNIDNLKLFNLYGAIVSYIYNPSIKNDARPFNMQYKYCRPSYKTFQQNGIIQKRSTISDYLNILQNDLNLIKFKNVGYIYSEKIKKRIKGVNHFVLVRDYPYPYNYDLLFKNILEGYKKAMSE
jgi:hypothetical protein